MYHPHKHGVLDQVSLSEVLRVVGKSGRAGSPTLILAVETIGVLHVYVSHIDKVLIVVKLPISVKILGHHISTSTFISSTS